MKNKSTENMHSLNLFSIFKDLYRAANIYISKDSYYITSLYWYGQSIKAEK